MVDLSSNAFIVQASIAIIGISVIIIAISLFLILARKRTAEENHAKKILQTLQDIKKGKKPVASSASPAPKLEIKKDEHSLKAMLVKKFKPKIEQQLSTKISIIDFNAKDENFLALVEISGVKILLTLDSSGKIIDYKKVKLG
jgi:hypothetical protein